MREIYQRYLKALLRIIDLLLAAELFLVANAFAFRGVYQFPDVENLSGYDYLALVVCLSLSVLVIVALSLTNNWKQLAKLWKINWRLILFLAFAVISIFWSVYRIASLYKLVFLLSTTLAASYLALRYQLRGIVSMISWMAGFSIVMSLWMLSTPLGIMHNDMFIGSWVGIFWHRNHTGSLFAFFSMIFLMRLLWETQGGKFVRVLFFLFYLLSVLFVVKSHSAAGAIVFLYLHLLIVLVSAWLKFYKKIERWQYYTVSVILVTGFLIFIFNTGYFFGLLGRSATMTGRTPLWRDLWSLAFSEKPIFGYGYGALWMQESFRHLMQFRHKWKYEVFFADSGFFDILLNLGMIGLILFMWFYLDLGVRSLKKLINEKSWLFAIPLLALNYVFIGNLAYSFMLEVDQFVWVLLMIWAFTSKEQLLMKDA